jgi:hypothetical protein
MKAGLKSSAITRRKLDKIGYHRLGELLEQLEILKTKANALAIL